MPRFLQQCYAILSLVLPLGVLFSPDVSRGNRIVRLVMLLLMLIGAWLVLNNYQQRVENAAQLVELPDWRRVRAEEVLEFTREHAAHLDDTQRNSMHSLIETQLRQLEHARELLNEPLILQRH